MSWNQFGRPPPSYPAPMSQPNPFLPPPSQIPPAYLGGYRPPFPPSFSSAPPPYPGAPFQAPSFPPPSSYPLGPPPGTAPAPAAAAPPPAAEPAKWTEHKDDSGKVYYYNEVTKESVWEKPSSLGAAVPSEPSFEWEEYETDDEPKRKYYYNKITKETLWEKPLAFKVYQIKKAAHEKMRQYSFESPPPVEVARELLESLYREVGMQKNWTQAQTFEAAGKANDNRWKWLKVSQKKKVYHKMVRVLADEELEERRRVVALKDDSFIGLLLESDLDDDISFVEAMAKVAGDPRYSTIPDVKTREILFTRYVKKKIQMQREAEEAVIKQSTLALIDFMKTSDRVNLTTKWTNFKDEFGNEEVFTALPEEASLKAFSTYVRGLFKEEEDKLRDGNKEFEDASRTARIEFRRLLDKFWVSGDINIESKWAAFLPSIKSEKSYLDLIGKNVTGSTPAQLFYDLVEDLVERYEADRKKLKKILVDLSYTFSSESTLEEFKAKLKENDSDVVLDAANVPFLFDDFKEASQKEAKREKQAAIKKFENALDDAFITSTSTLPSVIKRLDLDVESLPLSQVELEQLFSDHQKERKKHDEWDSSSEPEEGTTSRSQKRKNRKRQRHSSGDRHKSSRSHDKDRDDRDYKRRRKDR